jgi:hypothetical protein
VEAYLPRGVWTLVGRVHDAHGAVASVVAAVTVTVAAEAERGGEGRRRRLMHAEGGVGGADTEGKRAGVETPTSWSVGHRLLKASDRIARGRDDRLPERRLAGVAGEVAGINLGLGHVERRRLAQWAAEREWTPAEVTAAQRAVGVMEQRLEAGAAVAAVQLAAAYGWRFGGGGGEVAVGCGGVRVAPAAAHSRVLRVVAAVRASRAADSGGVVRPTPSTSQRESARVWSWWTHTGGGNALAFKQPTSPYDIESGPGGLTREVETPLMILRVDLVDCWQEMLSCVVPPLLASVATVDAEAFQLALAGVTSDLLAVRPITARLTTAAASCVVHTLSHLYAVLASRCDSSLPSAADGAGRTRRRPPWRQQHPLRRPPYIPLARPMRC